LPNSTVRKSGEAGLVRLSEQIQLDPDKRMIRSERHCMSDAAKARTLVEAIALVSR
jgi:hypothetical protein